MLYLVYKSVDLYLIHVATIMAVEELTKTDNFAELVSYRGWATPCVSAYRCTVHIMHGFLCPSQPIRYLCLWLYVCHLLFVCLFVCLFVRLTVVHFWAPWSEPCKQMTEAMKELAGEHTMAKFMKVVTDCDNTYIFATAHSLYMCTQVEAEEFPDLSLQYEVVAVPTVLLFKVLASIVLLCSILKA